MWARYISNLFSSMATCFYLASRSNGGSTYVPVRTQVRTRMSLYVFTVQLNNSIELNVCLNEKARKTDGHHKLSCPPKITVSGSQSAVQRKTNVTSSVSNLCVHHLCLSCQNILFVDEHVISKTILTSCCLLTVSRKFHPFQPIQ